MEKLTEQEFRALMGTDPRSAAVAWLSPEQVAWLSPEQVARLSPAAVARLSPEQVARLSPEQVARLSPEQVARLSPAAVAWLSPEQVAWLSPEQVARLSPAAVARLSPEQVARLSPEQVARLSPEQVARLSPAAVARLSPEQVARLSPAAVAWLSPEQVAWLSPEQVARHKALWDSVPKVDALYSTILVGIKAEKRIVNQSTFGPEEIVSERNLCNTPMCIAGHTVNCAGVPGYELMKRHGFAVAAALIHAKSRPDAPRPRYDNYPNEWALAYIEIRAAEEGK